MIKVEGVTKRYGRATAVRDISFEVHPGEIVGFLGPNGAGKTTTMRILTGFLPPTEGRAEVAGLDVVDNPLEVKRHIGYLPEVPPVYPEMNVEGYLKFVARIKAIPSADINRRVEAVMERTAITEFRKKLIGKLSKGYRQRVGLAQALIHNPDVLILDEPTAGLDPKQIREVRELVRSLAGEHTIILSSHILSEVAETCGRVIIINQGRIVATDSPQALTGRMQGGDSTQLEIDGSPEQIEPRLAALEGVVSVSRGPDIGSRSTWTVETDKNETIRSQLARAVVEAGFGLYGMKQVGLSLEDIFLELTASEEASQEPLPEEHREHEKPAVAHVGGDE